MYCIMICTDLWPEIISWVPARYLLRLSNASCLFDEIILRRTKSLGMIIWSNDSYDILQDDEDIIIRVGDNVYFVNSKECLIRRAFWKIHGIYGTMNVRFIESVNEITDDMIVRFVWTIDPKSYTIMAHNYDEYYIIKVNCFEFTRDKKLRVRIGASEKDLDILNDMLFGVLTCTGIPTIINFDTRVAGMCGCFSRVKILFRK